MSAGQQVGGSLSQAAAQAAGKAIALLQEMRSGAEAAVSVQPDTELPSWLTSIEAPVEIAVMPERMAQVAGPWREVFLPLSILQAEGRLELKKQARRQPWDTSLSLLEKLKAKTGGGALTRAKRILLEEGCAASWWLPAKLELLAAGDAPAERIRRRWSWAERNLADLSRQDLALAALALDPEAASAVDLGDAARLTQAQDGEGSWALDEFTGPVISTAFALDALRRQGIDEREAAVLRGAEWLRSVQNADGGWGGEDGSPSTPVRTACGVYGLVCGGDTGSESVRRGIGYLVTAQGMDGGWEDGGWNWQLLPGLVGCRSSLDALTMPLIALSSYLKKSVGVHKGG